MSDIFISYARKDRPTADKIAAALATRGWSIWWDRTIPTGQNFDQVIERELAAARCVIVLWSKASIESDWVRIEAEDAASRNILVPVRLEPDVRAPLRFRRIQEADFSTWDGTVTDEKFRTLAVDIGRLLESRAAAAPVSAAAAEPVAHNPASVLRPRAIPWLQRRHLLRVGVPAAIVFVAALWLLSRSGYDTRDDRSGQTTPPPGATSQQSSATPQQQPPAPSMASNTPQKQSKSLDAPRAEAPASRSERLSANASAGLVERRIFVIFVERRRTDAQEASTRLAALGLEPVLRQTSEGGNGEHAGKLYFFRDEYSAISQKIVTALSDIERLVPSRAVETSQNASEPAKLSLWIVR